MPLVPMRLLLDHAAENDYGLAAFNVNNMEQIQAILEAAKETDSPVIVQASRGARSYCQDNYLRHLMIAAAELYPQIPIVMHQDHGNSPDTCKSAIANGFTSVMMDGSLEDDGKSPADFDYNVRVTKDVVELAHAKGVSVEGELGCLGSLEHGSGEKEDGHGAEGVLTHDQLLTDPEEAERFVAETGVDALAVAIGTSHGAYKFTRKPTGEVLAMSRIEHGVRKINVDTDNRMAMTGAIRKVLAESPEKFDPRDYLKPASEAMKKVCVARTTSFGQAGWGPKIKPVALEKFKSYYAMV